VLDFGGGRIRLSGFVRRGVEPVRRATLLFTAPSGALTDGIEAVLTGGDGRYEIGLEQPGRYRVSVQEGGASGANVAAATIDVPDEPAVSRDIVLDSATIAGRVTDTARQAVVDATVFVQRDGDPAAEPLLASRTDATGTYELRGAADGAYVLTVSARGFAVARQAVEIDAGADTRADVVLERGRMVRGRVVDRLGQPSAGALVLVSPAGVPAALSPPVEADLDGRFEIAGPSDGGVDVTAIARGFAPSCLRGVMPDEGDGGLELVLGAGGGLRVRVLGPEGAPRAAAAVDVVPQPPFAGSELAALLRPTAPTDAAGETTLELLAPGSYAVRVAGRGTGVTVVIEDGRESLAVVRLGS
jgi:hypothetical protein